MGKTGLWDMGEILEKLYPKYKELIFIGAVGICALGIAFGIYKISDGKIFGRNKRMERKTR